MTTMTPEELSAIVSAAGNRSGAVQQQCGCDQEKDDTMIRAYEQDYAGWAEDTAKAIEEGRFEDIDRATLADEVKSLSGAEQSRLESALRVLLVHLLKAKYQPHEHTRSWDNTIAVQRLHINKFLRKSPSLHARLSELLVDAYQTARYDAATETGLDPDTFPEICGLSDFLG